MGLEKVGGPMPEYMLYNAKYDVAMKCIGFSSPDGQTYSFRNNEQGLVQFDRHNNGERKTYVELEDGTLKPVEVWITKNNS